MSVRKKSEAPRYRGASHFLGRPGTPSKRLRTLEHHALGLCRARIRPTDEVYSGCPTAQIQGLFLRTSGTGARTLHQ